MPDDLATRFRAMSDDEMLHLGSEYATLTDDAQNLVRTEFSRRKLEIPDMVNVPSDYETQRLRTIRRYRDQPEAIMARSVLESTGIPCFLRDENMVRLNWGVSNMIGGLRLQVAESDVAAAEAVLSGPIPQRIAVEGEPDYDQPQCPNCGSLDSSFNTTDTKAATVSLYLIGIPLPLFGNKNYWHCNDCGTNWTDDTQAGACNDA